MPLGNSNNNRAPAIFVQLNAKLGAFVTTDKVPGEGGALVNQKTQHTELSNVFVRGVKIMDNKNFDNPDQIDKVIGVRLRDATDGQEYVLKANPSALTSRLLGLINAADLSQPITLQVGAFAAGTKKTLQDKSTVVRQAAEPFLIAAQNGQKVFAKWSDDPAFVLPKTVEEEVKIGGKMKKVKDSSARDEWMIGYASELDNKVAAKVGEQNAPQAKMAAAPAVPAEIEAEHHAVGGDAHSINADDLLGGEDDANAFLEKPTA